MVSRKKIIEADERISKYKRVTPLILSKSLSNHINEKLKIDNVNVYLKLETHQKSGSFKIRGALNKIFIIKKDHYNNRVCAASTGNHALGVASAAKLLEMNAIIFMPEWASNTKFNKVKKKGAKIFKVGKSLEDCIKKAEIFASKEKIPFIHPFNDKEIIAGQGTIAIEILSQKEELEIDELDIIVAPIGGGGLIAGIVSFFKDIQPKICIIGAKLSIDNNKGEISRIVDLFKKIRIRTIAEGIFVQKEGVKTRKIYESKIQKFSATEDDIAKAISYLFCFERYKKKRVIAEGAGAVSLAILLNGSLNNLITKIYYQKRKVNIVLIISGKNIKYSQAKKISEMYYSSSFESKVTDDVPT